ncbi:MAG: RNA polymerase sigma-70 factor [Ruminococcus flavefaciens]|nr:RNA polymerase sigma-70 factor [Bacteroides sp.]MCM1235447.1 RNA polymerase sigma-70 factor [Ruminococcus flavefaciens]
MAALTEEQIEKVRDGNIAAFEAFFNHYYPRIRSFALGFLKDTDEAEEAAQIVFMKIWQGRSRLLPGRQPDSYVFTITRNVVNDMFRDRYYFQHYREQYLSDRHETDYEIDREIDIRDISKSIDEIVESMPEQRRQVFVLSRRYYLTNDEIARRLDISKRTVEKHISLALKTIRQKKGDFFLWLILFVINF